MLQIIVLFHYGERLFFILRNAFVEFGYQFEFVLGLGDVSCAWLSWVSCLSGHRSGLNIDFVPNVVFPDVVEAHGSDVCVGFIDRVSKRWDLRFSSRNYISASVWRQHLILAVICRHVLVLRHKFKLLEFIFLLSLWRHQIWALIERRRFRVKI